MAKTKATLTPVPQWLGYQGNKNRLIEILMPMVPDGTRRFVDLFGGTGIVGINAHHHGKCDEVVYNELNPDMVRILRWMSTRDLQQALAELEEVRSKWFPEGQRLDMSFKEPYKELERYYNATEDKDSIAAVLFLLVTNSRFLTPSYKADGTLNLTPKIYSATDTRKPTFLTTTTPGTIDFMKAVRAASPTLHNCDFSAALGKEPCRDTPQHIIDGFTAMIDSLDEHDLVFVDAPYLGSDAQYNKLRGQSWKSAQGQMLDIYLFALCQMLDERGIPFIFTNNIEYNTQVFREWCKLWNVYRLESGRSMDGKNHELYQGKAQQSSGEVILTNFRPKGKQHEGAYFYYHGSTRLAPGSKTAWYGLQREEDIKESVEKDWRFEK